MSNYNSNLQTNNTNLQSILDTINALPEAGTDLPELTNPANASEVFLGKEVIDQDGNAVTGTFTIDNEVNAQEDLLTELQTALAGKIAGGGSVGNIETCTVFVEGGSHAFYTGIENNVIIAKRFPANSLESSSSFSIPDCICNSSICVYDNNSATTQLITSTNAELLYRSELSQIFKITASAGQTATIKISASTHSGGAIV